MTIKTKFNYAQCSISVSGTDMICPLCGTLVRSGERHNCELREPKKKPIKRSEGLR